MVCGHSIQLEFIQPDTAGSASGSPGCSTIDRNPCGLELSPDNVQEISLTRCLTHFVNTPSCAYPIQAPSITGACLNSCTSLRTRI